MRAGLKARRGYISLAADRQHGWVGGERWRKRGIWIIGVELQTSSQQQVPGMNILLLDTMHISNYESAKDLAKSLFCNAYLHPTQFGPLNFWHEDTQEYYPWLKILKTKQEQLMQLIILLTTMTK